MDPSRTQAEWQAIFKDARKDATVEPTGSTISERPSLSEVSTLREKIDHTLLKLDASEPQIDALCDEAILYAFKVCGLMQVFPLSALSLLGVPRSSKSVLRSSIKDSSFKSI